MPRVIISSPLRKFTNNQRKVTVVGDSLREAMDCLLGRYPGLNRVVNDCALLSVFVNSKMVRTRTDKWDKVSLNEDDEIALIIPIAGG